MRDASHEAIRNLIMALLAVNNCSLERVYGCHEKFEQQGIFDPEEVVKWNTETAAQRLATAGFDRGSLNPILAERLFAVSQFLRAGGLTAFLHACGNRDIQEVGSTLRGIRGVGPFVLRNFSILMDWE